MNCNCTPDQLVEKWLPIPGYESHYSVSSFGRIRREMTVGNTYAGRILNPSPNSDGYPIFGAHRNGYKKTVRVHRAVALAFLGTVPDGHEVNHKDGVKSHCHLANLEYQTDSGNTQHAYDTGLITPMAGSNNPWSILDERDAREIKQRLAAGEQPTEIARDYPVGRTAISNIKHGRSWSHVAEV